MRRFTPASLGAHFARLAASADVKLAVGPKLVAANTKHHARDIFGDSSKLKDLAPATQDERVALGFTPNDPLVRTGELRDSVYDAVEGNVAAVGSDLEKMYWHELGTIRIPARPVLQIAAMEAAEENLTIAAEIARSIATGDVPRLREAVAPKSEVA